MEASMFCHTAKTLQAAHPASISNVLQDFSLQFRELVTCIYKTGAAQLWTLDNSWYLASGILSQCLASTLRPHPK